MYLGLDLGTSSLKALVVNEYQTILYQVEAPLSCLHIADGWSEQHPTAWVKALEACMFQLANQGALSGVVAIGLSGQMHGSVLLDQNHKVLRPAILWNDTRSKSQCAQLEQTVPNFRLKSGNLAMPGFTAPKLLWIKEHEPALFEKIAHVLLPKDFLAFYLTGELGTDLSDASGTLWLDPESGEWNQELVEATSLRLEQLPKIQQGHEIRGLLKPALARDWGMGAVIVAAGAGDNAASAIGTGLVSPGQSLISLGTSGVFFEVSDVHRPNPDQAVHDFRHTVGGLWLRMAVTLSAASCLGWLSNLLATPIAELLSEVEKSARRETSVLFHPYLMGERTPLNSPTVRASFTRLGIGTQRSDLTLSVMEGVAFSLLEGVELVTDAVDRALPIVVTGGGTKSLLWCQILASIMDRPIQILENSDHAAALGAALLGKSAFEARDVSPKSLSSKTKILAPESNLHEYYNRKFEFFKTRQRDVPEHRLPNN